jgi:hypothetical protein
MTEAPPTVVALVDGEVVPINPAGLPLTPLPPQSPTLLADSTEATNAVPAPALETPGVLTTSGDPESVVSPDDSPEDTRRVPVQTAPDTNSSRDGTPKGASRPRSRLAPGVAQSLAISTALAAGQGAAAYSRSASFEPSGNGISPDLGTSAPTLSPEMSSASPALFGTTAPFDAEANLASVVDQDPLPPAGAALPSALTPTADHSSLSTPEEPPAGPPPGVDAFPSPSTAVAPGAASATGASETPSLWLHDQAATAVAKALDPLASDILALRNRCQGLLAEATGRHGIGIFDASRPTRALFEAIHVSAGHLDDALAATSARLADGVAQVHSASDNSADGYLPGAALTASTGSHGEVPA